MAYSFVSFFFFSHIKRLLHSLETTKTCSRICAPLPPQKKNAPVEESSCKQISYKYTMVSAMLKILV